MAFQTDPSSDLKKKKKLSTGQSNRLTPGRFGGVLFWPGPGSARASGISAAHSADVTRPAEIQSWQKEEEAVSVEQQGGCLLLPVSYR